MNSSAGSTSERDQSTSEARRPDVPGEDHATGARLPLPVVLVAAWLVPGSGHLLQRRWVRGVTFLLLVCFSTLLGAWLDGKLFAVEAGKPLSTLGTLASMGSGVLYGVLRWVLEYEGDIRSATYEYGGAFLLTAGLMNLLALLDAWDVASGRKP